MRQCLILYTTYRGNLLTNRGGRVMEFLIFIALIFISLALSGIRVEIREVVNILEKIKRGY